MEMQVRLAPAGFATPRGGDDLSCPDGKAPGTPSDYP